jgi:hypothetical protein
MTTTGTHNLHDEDLAIGFADILFFTEAIPDEVYDALSEDYVVNVCRWQKDLIICWRKGLDIKDLGSGYRFAHIGIVKVTPRRGTYIKKVRLNGAKTKLLCHHRINAAFPPYIRGESRLRPLFWRRHTKMDVRYARRSIRRGWQILTGGDPNTPKDVLAWRGLLDEAADGFDRLGSHPRRLRNVTQTKAKEAVHPRLSATVAA